MAEDHGQLVKHIGFFHFVIEVSAFTGALAHAGKDGQAVVLRRDGVDQLLDGYGFADAGAAEDAGLAALGHGGDQVDDFHTGLEDFDGRRLVFE